MMIRCRTKITMKRIATQKFYFDESKILRNESFRTLTLFFGLFLCRISAEAYYILRWWQIIAFSPRASWIYRIVWVVWFSWLLLFCLEAGLGCPSCLPRGWHITNCETVVCHYRLFHIYVRRSAHLLFADKKILHVYSIDAFAFVWKFA